MTSKIHGPISTISYIVAPDRHKALPDFVGSILIPVKTAFLTCRTPEKLRNWKKRLFCKLFLTSSLSWDFFVAENVPLRNGPLENLWAGGGGGGGGEEKKKNSRKAKLKEKNSCTPINRKNINATA